MTTDALATTNASPLARSSIPEIDMQATIERMVEAKLDPTEMYRLIKEMRADAAEAAYMKAMAACQAEVGSLVQKHINKHAGNALFAKLEEIQAVVGPVAAKHGFSTSFSEVEATKGPEWVRTICEVMHVGGHRKFHWKELPIDDKGAKGGDAKTKLHGCASSETYAKKRLLAGIFNLRLTNEPDDDDGNGGGGNDQKVLSTDQAVTIQDAMKEVNATDADWDRLLVWIGTKAGFECKSLDEVPAALYPKIMAALKTKQKVHK